MKILYLIDEKKYSYHKYLVKLFLPIIPGEVYDMSGLDALYEKFNYIRDYSPNVIISFDLAGFELRTVDNTLSLNGIYCRQANILFQKATVYGQDLMHRQNLSMYTYVCAKDDSDKLKETYREVPNIYRMPEIWYKPSNNIQEETNKENIKKWWDEFKKEARL